MHGAWWQSTGAPFLSVLSPGKALDVRELNWGQKREPSHVHQRTAVGLFAQLSEEPSDDAISIDQ